MKLCALATDSQALCFKGKQANMPALLKGKEMPAPRHGVRCSLFSLDHALFLSF